MKVTVNGNRIIMPLDAKISITRKSPLFNDDSGTFSYPSPVSTEANRKALGFPERLQRTNRIDPQPFIIEEGGLQLLTGILDHDKASRKETGLIFKSGETDFSSRAKGKNLSDIDFSTFYLWPENSTAETVDTAIDGWNVFNQNAGSFDATLAPCVMESGSDLIQVNKVSTSTGEFNTGLNWSTYTLNVKLYFMFQFHVRWILEKIIEAFDFKIGTNDFSALTNKYRDTVIFSNPFLVNGSWARDGQGNYVYTAITPYDSINIADLMPEMSILDFKEAIETAFCLQIDFDDRRKIANIYFVDKIFTSPALKGKGLVELDGWENDVNPQNKGYALRYESQENDADTEEDFLVTDTTNASALPDPDYEGQLIHFAIYDRHYVAELDDDDNLYWNRIGRLKGIVSGSEDLFEQTINATIPEQVAAMGAETPKLKISVNSYQKGGGVIGELTKLYLSVYRGMDLLDNITFPLLCAEEYTMADDSLPYQVVGFPDSNLQPKCLITLHQNYLEFQANAISSTKYFMANLVSVINLQFNRRYIINGIPIILDAIRFDLPYEGIFKADVYSG